MRTRAWPTASPVTEFTTEPLRVKEESFLCEGDICATAVAAKMDHKLKASRRRNGFAQSNGGDGKYRLAKPRTNNCR